MRHGGSWAVLAVLILVGCETPSKPFRDMVGYVPPTSLPAQPKRTMVRDRPEQVWNDLLAYLRQSFFQIDHLDAEQMVVVARYSGDPEPYIDCGSIVTHENGTLGQIPAAIRDVALNHELDQRPVVLKRRLNLDSRIIIRLQPQQQGTVVSTETTYVVTKAIDIEDVDGDLKEGNSETISFGTGKRAEFSKGTACQPTGALDLAVLDSLPNASRPTATFAQADQAPEEPDATEVAVAEDLSGDVGTTVNPDAAPPPTPSELAKLGVPLGDWILPDEGLPPGARPKSEAGPDRPSAGTPPAAADQPEADPQLGGNRAPDVGATAGPPASTTVATVPKGDQAVTFRSEGQDTGSIVDETTRALLSALECDGEEWHFCRLVELTAPYRKLNIDELYGLTVNTKDSFTSQVIGNDLRLDIRLPTFPAYLHIAYAQRNGVFNHIISSAELWPQGLSHQVEATGYTIPGPEGVAMIIAIASEAPLFEQSTPFEEDGESYLARLEQRLAEIKASGRITTASHLLINVNKAQP